MDKIVVDKKQYVMSGKYFTDGLQWYQSKYMLALTHRLWLAITAATLAVVLIALLLNLQTLLPIIIDKRYVVNVPFIGEDSATIASIHDYPKHYPAQHFVSANMVEHYIKAREEYNYDKLATQVRKVKNASNKLIFRNYYQYLSLDNPDSPILRYKKNATRKIYIKQVKFLSDQEVLVDFRSEAYNNRHEIFENMNWQVKINFEIEDFTKIKYTESDTIFEFRVTDYQLRLLGTNNVK